MKLVCVQCEGTFKVTKIGVPFEETFEDGKPYKLWTSDRLTCPGCGTEVLIVGDGQGPISEHYKPDYDTLRRSYDPVLSTSDRIA